MSEGARQASLSPNFDEFWSFSREGSMISNLLCSSSTQLRHTHTQALIKSNSCAEDHFLKHISPVCIREQEQRRRCWYTGLQAADWLINRNTFSFIILVNVHALHSILIPYFLLLWGWKPRGIPASSCGVTVDLLVDSWPPKSPNLAICVSQAVTWGKCASMFEYGWVVIYPQKCKIRPRFHLPKW